MDGILPPSASPNAQLQLGQQHAFEAHNLITQLQSKIPIGTTMMAQILGNDKNGNLIVKVNGSDLLLSSPLALVKGAQVQMKVETIGGHISAQLISLDGKLPVYRPQGAEGQYQAPKGQEQNSVPVRIISVLNEGVARNLISRAGAQANNALQAAQRIDQVNLSSLQTTVMRAMVIHPAPEIMQGIRAALALSVQSEQKLIKTLPSELTAGMEANVKIMGVQNEPKPQNSATPNIQNNPAIGENEIVETSNTVLKKQDWIKPEQNALQHYTKSEQGLQSSLAKKAEALPADWAKNFTPTMKAMPNGNLQISALVVDDSAEGEVLVETRLGLLRIDGKTASFPKGTELELEMVEFTKVTLPVKAKNELPSLTHEWAALKTALGENKQEAVKLAGAEHNFGGKLVNFINAVRSGDAESWLGAEFLDQIDDMVRNTLVNRLNSDFANFRNLMAENPLNPWQTLLFPVFDGQELNQARLHVKKFKDDSAASADGYGTRFIVELDTSRYGEMQFDGLVRRLMPKKSFDLIIRTHDHLDMETKAEIIAIFNTTQEITGFNGGIEFASGPHFPLEPWKDLLSKKGPHDNLIS